MERIKCGIFEVANPFNRYVRKIPATSDNVHTLVFWSKNFALFLAHNYGEKLQDAGYNLFFNFTINSDSPQLEPRVPPLAVRLSQLKQLCNRFGPRTINWRFDPICFFKDPTGRVKDNLGDLSLIAQTAAELGIKRCITSFMDRYPKIDRRLTARPGFSFIDPPLDAKRHTVIKMEQVLTSAKIGLMLCCEKEVAEMLPNGSTVTQSACIPNELLMELFGGKLSCRRDTGQRIQKGCGCRVSMDIGDYRLHPCYHNCLFCYANPTSK